MSTHEMHGMARSPEYKAWQGMLDRCTNPNSQRWHRYGGRGIAVCTRWRAFSNFFADLGRRPSPKHSLDRIDNDGNWTIVREPCVTTMFLAVFLICSRLVDHLTFPGSLADWAAETGINFYTLRNRVLKNWPAEKLFSRPRGAA